MSIICSCKLPHCVHLAKACIKQCLQHRQFRRLSGACTIQCQHLLCLLNVNKEAQPLLLLDVSNHPILCMLRQYDNTTHSSSILARAAQVLCQQGSSAPPFPFMSHTPTSRCFQTSNELQIHLTSQPARRQGGTATAGTATCITWMFHTPRATNFLD